MYVYLSELRLFVVRQYLLCLRQQTKEDGFVPKKGFRGWVKYIPNSPKKKNPALFSKKQNKKTYFPIDPTV